MPYTKVVTISRENTFKQSPEAFIDCLWSADLVVAGGGCGRWIRQPGQLLQGRAVSRRSLPFDNVCFQFVLAR